jgi:hypothetical protein
MNSRKPERIEPNWPADFSRDLIEVLQPMNDDKFQPLV